VHQARTWPALVVHKSSGVTSHATPNYFSLTSDNEAKLSGASPLQPPTQLHNDTAQTRQGFDRDEILDLYALQ
jgi:hypothetical protein